MTKRQLVIHDARIVEGTGRPAFCGDIAVADGFIAAIGGDVGQRRREIYAGGAMLGPGWVVIHSHWDGQATLDPLMSPSGRHGVTTTLFGNCCVGFALA